MQKRGMRGGFTLIELLVVMSIIGVLAGMGMMGIPMIMKQVKITKAKNDIKSIEMALSMYKNDYGIYPNDATPEQVSNDLTGYASDPETPDEKYKNDPEWKGPYLRTEPKQHEYMQRNRALVDPWGKKYQYRLNNPEKNKFGVDIWSPGPDGVDDKGEKDDVNNWR